jgi:coatomer protein complex subunit gamma
MLLASKKSLSAEIIAPLLGSPQKASKKEKALESITTYQEQLSTIPRVETFGTLFKSTQPKPLTESETEYIVEYIKHVFSEHVVFQVSPNE